MIYLFRVLMYLLKISLSPAPRDAVSELQPRVRFFTQALLPSRAFIPCMLPTGAGRGEILTSPLFPHRFALRSPGFSLRFWPGFVVTLIVQDASFASRKLRDRTKHTTSSQHCQVLKSPMNEFSVPREILARLNYSRSIMTDRQ